MHQIEMNAIEGEFMACWQAAGSHIAARMPKGDGGWLRSHPHPPVLEHLSFRVGNQLYFVRVEDVDGRVRGPASLAGLLDVAREANGRACVLPMRRDDRSGRWSAARAGWGLVDASTGAALDPIALATGALTPMSAWELQDFAVQVVRDAIAKDGHQLLSWQGRPGVDPSIWFLRRSGGPEWVVVRPAVFPSRQATRPANWAEIAASCARMSRAGHFASVAVASAAQPFQSSDEAAVPLWRGQGMFVRYVGLE